MKRISPENDHSITYLNRTFRTSLSKPMTDEEYYDVVKYILERPEWDKVEKEFKSIYKNKSTKISAITGWYFLHLMYEARNGQDAWSIAEALHHKPIMEYFNAKCAVNTKIFPLSDPLGKRIKDAFRLCGIRCCRKVAQFPMKNLDNLFNDYCKEGDNYYDFSCGWGSRMLSSIKHNINYYGTDPNSKLIDKINECHNDYDKINNTSTFIDIRAQGSEIFVSEWEDKMNFIFSSPPYFNLEIYQNGKQSYIEGETTYDSWFENWMWPTLNNIYRYLKKDGIFAINIQDVETNKKKWPLENDTLKLCNECGFELVEVRTLKNIKRVTGSVFWEKHTVNISDKGDENIYVFKKR